MSSPSGQTPTDLHSLFADVARYAAERRAGDGDRRHAPTITYAEALERFRLPADLPPTPADEVIRDLIARTEPGLAAMTGPRFFGWVIGGSNPVGVAADWLTSIWGQNTANHLATPSASAAEEAAAAALLDLFDLPRGSSVGFTSGATMASFTALAAARGEVLRRAGWDCEADGLFGAPPVHVLLGEEAHSTIFAALKYLGLGMNRVVRIAVDDNGAMRPDALAGAARELSGPMIIIAQAGNLLSGAIDPMGPIANVAASKGAWMHVDGAFGLWARACPDTARMAEGIDRADSWSVDGHKWLQTPYDCAYAIVRDPAAHRAAMQIPAPYLPGGGDGLRNPSDITPELSRRARGFATWAILRHLGRAGISSMISRHCALARRAGLRFGQQPDVRVLNAVVLNQVAVRFGTDLDPALADQLTGETIQRVQNGDACFVGGSTWKGQKVIRLSVIGESTTEADIDRSCDAILAAWRDVRNRA
jgi:glutamate/tyrosine decarboxylase-like PLP-dependent enzyme